ncbi:hypothetical protein G6F63_016295 [Rhizopus arrhizus]|nr:hypothetical protein G6F63_016295 [Rhizopus arrhizus]
MAMPPAATRSGNSACRHSPMPRWPAMRQHWPAAEGRPSIRYAGPLQAAFVLKLRCRRPAGAGHRISGHQPPAAAIGNTGHFRA